MRKQDTGAAIQDAAGEVGRAPLAPASRIMDPVVLQRLRWRCRRGLLELDILLGRFVEKRYPNLDEQQQAAFDELLDMPDTELWDTIIGKREVPHAHQRAVIEWLKEV